MLQALAELQLSLLELQAQLSDRQALLQTLPQQVLANQILPQRFQRFKGNPVNAIHRTGVDGLLNAFGGVTVLSDGP